MPCKISPSGLWRWRVHPKRLQERFKECTVEFHDSTRQRMESSQPKICRHHTYSYARESISGWHSGFTEQSKFFVICEIFTILNQVAALERPTFPVKPYFSEAKNLSALRFWSAAWCTELYGYHRKRFQPPSAQEGLSSAILNKFKEYGIIFSGMEALDHRNCKEERVKWKENRGMRRFFYTVSKIEVVCWIKVVELWELRLRKCILENFLTPWNFDAGNSSSELRFV